MTILIFRGDAQPRAQVTHVTPAGVEIGDTFTLTINRKDITFEATEATLANVVAGLVAAVGQYSNDIPEFAEISASTGFAADGETVTHLVLTGPEDGKPFTVTASASNVGGFGVSVATVQEGVAPTNEIQRVVLPGPPTGGTFTLTFDGQTTAAQPFNETAANIQADLEALSNIAAGDVVVTGDAPDFTVEFTQAYEGVNVPLMTGNGSSLTGGAKVNIATTTQGSAGTNEVQQLLFTGSENFILGYDDGSLIHATSIIPGTATAAQVQSALEALTPIGTGNVLVSKPASVTWLITFVGALGNTNILPLRCNASPGGNNHDDDVTTVTEGSATGVNEVQTVTINNAPTGGTFTLTFSGATTAGIAFNAADTAVLSALEALANIAPGDVTVSRGGAGTLSSPYVYTVTFLATYASTDVAQMTGSAASLTGSAVSVTTTQEAAAGTNEQQSITLTGGATGGTFTLTWDPGGGDETTGNIAYDASAATVQAALEGLATPAPGDFVVTGAAGGPWIIEFTGTYAVTDVNAITGDGANLTGAGTQGLTVESPNEVEPTGPNWWDEPENWSTGSNPANGDTVYLKDSAVDVLYGLEDLAAVTLAELHIDLSYTGDIGLADADENGYYQYRPKYLKQPATLIFIGEGQGPGGSLWRLDTAAVQTALLQYGSGRPDDSSLPAVQWIGTHASNVARIFKGSFGAAAEAGTTAVLLTLQIGYQVDRESDVEYMIGAGCNLDDVAISGGTGDIDLSINAAGDIVMTGGTVRVLGDMGVDLVQLSGEAYCYYNTTGTLGGTTIVTDEATLDFTQDMRTKTVTNPIEVYSREARVIDRHVVVTGLVVDYNFTEVTVNGSEIGSNVRVTRGTPA